MDNLLGQHENFQYDQSDRLTAIIPYNGSFVGINYLSNGNIQSQGDVGNYEYNDVTHPHAVTGITGNTTIPSLGQIINYNAFGKVSFINEGNNSLYIDYGVDQQRIRCSWQDSKDFEKTKTYIGDYEKVETGTNTQKFHYIYSPTGLTAVMIRTGNVDSLFYVCTDHLGSITALINEQGTVVERHSYDAWGRERNPNDWSSYTVAAGRLDRGFTGHEAIREFGLINMNGRVYPYSWAYA